MDETKVYEGKRFKDENVDAEKAKLDINFYKSLIKRLQERLEHYQKKNAELEKAIESKDARIQKLESALIETAIK